MKRLCPVSLTLLLVALLCAPAFAAGKFFLVGVGCGDPDLITLRAINRIEQSQVIVCPWPWAAQKFAQYLKGKEVRTVDGFLFRYYGMDPNKLQGKAREQCLRNAREREKIINAIVADINAGKNVALLTDGDPLIYGPDGWYLYELHDRGVSTEVVPGISAFNAANAALEVDPTSGQGTASVILTMKDTPGRRDTLDKLAAHRTTMVIFTMFLDLSDLVSILRKHYPPETPLAIVVKAGYAKEQEVIRGTLATIEDKVRGRELPFEHIIYVGDCLGIRPIYGGPPQ